MGAKATGGVFLVLSVPLLLAGVVYFAMDPSPIPTFGMAPTTASYVVGGLGVLLLLLGIILLMVVAPKKRGAPVQEIPEEQRTVEIKRTEMAWGAPAGPSPTEELQGRLEAVNQKLARIKVQFGMGELSNESYKLLAQQYEQERAIVERQIIDLREGAH